MALELNIPENELAFEQEIDLDGTLYVLRFRYNGRAENWYLDLLDGEESPIALSIAIQGNISLTGYLRGLSGAPKGEFVCVDTQGRGDKPGQTDLGTRHKIVYLTETEVASLG